MIRECVEHDSVASLPRHTPVVFGFNNYQFETSFVFLLSLNAFDDRLTVRHF